MTNNTALIDEDGINLKNYRMSVCKDVTRISIWHGIVCQID